MKRKRSILEFFNTAPPTHARSFSTDEFDLILRLVIRHGWVPKLNAVVRREYLPLATNGLACSRSIAKTECLTSAAFVMAIKSNAPATEMIVRATVWRDLLFPVSYSFGTPNLVRVVGVKLLSVRVTLLTCYEWFCGPSVFDIQDDWVDLRSKQDETTIELIAVEKRLTRRYWKNVFRLESEEKKKRLHKAR